MSSGLLDFPEQFDAGLNRTPFQRQYYFARGPQLVNAVVDIGRGYRRRCCDRVVRDHDYPHGQGSE